MTEQELQAIVEQAEERGHWASFPSLTQLELSKQDAQFILDAIRAIPIQRDIIAQKDKEIAEADALCVEVLQANMIAKRDSDDKNRWIEYYKSKCEQLEAKLAKLEGWESVENPPALTEQEEWSSSTETDWGTEWDAGEYFTSKPIVMLTEGKGIYWAEGEKTSFEVDEYTVLGWKFAGQEQP